LELKTILAVIRRRIWVIILTLAVTIATAVIFALLSTPIYSAKTIVRVVSSPGSTGNYSDYVYAGNLKNTYAIIATSQPVVDELMLRFQLTEAPEILVEVVSNTEIIEITVQDPNPAVARDVANALAEILITKSNSFYTGEGKSPTEILSEQLAQTETELNQARQEYDTLASKTPQDIEKMTALATSIQLKERTYATLLDQYEQARVREALRENTISVVEPASLPESPTKPNKLLIAALGCVAGLVGGVGLAFVFENLDDTLHTSQEIEALTELPAMGKIPTAKGSREFIVFNESFRHLRTNLFRLNVENPPKTILVTSAQPGEGKSTIVVNLANSLAQVSKKVVVVDGDMRIPRIHEQYSLSNQTGLSQVLKGEITLKAALQTAPSENVKVLTSGPIPTNPVELLGLPAMAEIIEDLRNQFDFILLDAPSLLAVADAAVIMARVDEVLLVIGRSQVQEQAVRAALRQLEELKSKKYGIVINRAELNGSYYYYRASSHLPLDISNNGKNRKSKSGIEKQVTKRSDRKS
jgi:polysaccharide biosynthesis transport protein